MKRKNSIRKWLIIHIVICLILFGTINGVLAKETTGDGKNEKKDVNYKTGKEVAIATGEMAEEKPVMAFDGTSYLIVWEDQRSGSFDIYGARVSSSGEVLDPEGIPISTAAHDQINAGIVWTGQHYFVIWQDKRSENNWEIYGARVTPSGKILDPDGIPISTGHDDRTSPSAASNGQDVFAAWERWRPAPAKADIYGARVSREGKLLDREGIPIAVLPDEQYYSAVSWNGRNYMVVWSDRRSETSFDIYGARVTPEGSVMDKNGILISGAENDQFFPTIAWNGNVHMAAWMDKRNGLPAIYGARINREGQVLDSEGIGISTNPEFHALPFASARGEEFLVVWEEDIRISNNDLFGVRLDSAGKVLDPGIFEIYNEFEVQTSAQSATDGEKYFIVWMDQREGIPFQGDIYGQFFDFSRSSQESPADPDQTLKDDGGELSMGSFMIHQISVDSKNPDTLYAATSHYGILKSTDQGQNWTLTNKGLKSYTHHQVVVNPREPLTVYAGAWGGGVSKSTDGGVSWREVNNGLGDTAVNAMAFYPGDPEVLYVAAKSGVYASRNGGRKWEPMNSGLERSNYESFIDILILPKWPHDIFLGSTKGLYHRNEKSKKWTVLRKKDGEAITSLAYSTGKRLLYAGTNSSGLLSSKDMGNSWTQVEGTGNLWVTEIVIDPVVHDTIYLATKGHGIFKSADGGKTWKESREGFPELGIKSLTMDPWNPRTLYAGTSEGGIYVSTDGGGKWVRSKPLPRLTMTEILRSLPVDDNMRVAREVDILVKSPELVIPIFRSNKTRPIPPPEFVKCNGCHGWTDPDLNLRRTQWRVPANVRDWNFTVKKRMSERSHLSPKEEKVIIRFLEQYSTKAAQQDAAIDTMHRVCSSCHGLTVDGQCLTSECGDGTVHSAGGRPWSFVVDWMMSMGAVINDKDNEVITKYLDENYPSKDYPVLWEKAVSLPVRDWNVTTMRAIGPYIYAGTEGGGRIYRSPDGKVWDEVCSTGGIAVYGITHFKGSYYAGVNDPRPEIWSSPDGKKWFRKAVLPEDQTGVISLGSFKEHLYAGTARGRLFRSYDGERWEEAAVLKQTEAPHWTRFILEFKDKIYAGTQLGYIYRSRDGAIWEEVGGPVREGKNRYGLRGAEVFDGSLYVGSITHGEIWKSENGEKWEMVFDATPDRERGYVASMTVYDRSLYSGIRTHSGFIYRTDDGLKWTEVGNISPYTTEAMTAFKGNLYAGSLIPPRANIYQGSVKTPLR